jgi:hypothetical protein
MNWQNVRLWFAIMAFLALLFVLLVDPSDDFRLLESFPPSL